MAQMFSAYSGDCVAAYFSRFIDGYIAAVNDSFEAVRDTLGIARTPDYVLTQDEKDLLKAYLASLITLLNFYYFSYKKDRTVGVKTYDEVFILCR